MKCNLTAGIIPPEYRHHRHDLSCQTYMLRQLCKQINRRWFSPWRDRWCFDDICVEFAAISLNSGSFPGSLFGFLVCEILIHVTVARKSAGYLLRVTRLQARVQGRRRWTGQRQSSGTNFVSPGKVAAAWTLMFDCWKSAQVCSCGYEDLLLSLLFLFPCRCQCRSRVARR